MTSFPSRDAAQAAADERNRALGDADHRWIVHHADGERWELARVGGAGLPGRAGGLHEERGPERAPSDDPRPFIQRLIPPFGPN
jgi:hypothetical protein